MTAFELASAAASGRKGEAASWDTISDIELPMALRGLPGLVDLDLPRPLLRIGSFWSGSLGLSFCRLFDVTFYFRDFGFELFYADFKN